MHHPPPPSEPSSAGASSTRGASIQFRLLVLVAASALPMLLFAVVLTRQANRTARATAESQALQLARRIAARVDDHVSTVDALLAALSRTVEPDARQRQRNDALLAAVSRDVGERFLNISVADADGHVVGLSSPGGTPVPAVSVADRRYFQEARRSRGFAIGDPMIGRLSGHYAIAFGRAIVDPRGRVRGVVAASTRLEQLRRIVVPADLPAEAIVTVLDSRGVVLARSRDGARWVGRDISGLSSTRETLREREGVREVVGIDGVTRLSGYATATRAPWFIYVGIPSAVALLPVREQERTAALLGGASLALSLVLAWLLARTISAPVRILTTDAAAFAAGDLTHRTAVATDGEVGALARTFNRMADALQRHSAELRESETRYRSLFDTIPLPVWVYDTQTLRFLAVNQAAVEQYGYSREEFLAMTVEDIRPPEDRARLRRSRALTGGGPDQHQRWRHLTRDGQLRDVEISSDELVYGTARARLVVVNDVSARVRTEAALRASQEQLRQSQKMEAVGSLAGGIAHDFNNLLTAILGYCDLALENVPPTSTVRDDVEGIRSAAGRAADLTHQLLAFSRRQVLKPRVFPLAQVVEQTERILRRLIGENIEIELVLSDDAALVRADPTQVEQVILNLAVNARDAMPAGGRIRLGTALALHDGPVATAGATLPAGAYAALTVSDTGTGIPLEIRDRLFEPFFTTKERGQGTGLGLATAYGIVQQSGGGIAVSSEVGHGTTFTVYFPVVTSAPDVVPAVASGLDLVGSSRGQGTILLAEDDEAVRSIAREALERAGYDVLAAADGAAALALADAHPGSIDLLVTDVIMPGMNGRELADQLGARRPGTPVLFASGYTDNVLAAQLAPGVALLDKPFTPALLTARVAALLSRRPVALGA